MIAQHVLLPFATRLTDADTHSTTRLTPERLHAIVELIPDAWLDDEPTFASKTEHRAAYLRYLQRRLAAPRAFALEARRAHAQHV